MKRYLFLVFVLLSYLVLAGCASNRNAHINTDLTNETWMRQVDANPHPWAYGVDNWFLNGDPNSTEMANREAPYSAAISTMQVRVPDFNNIKVEGDFQVQIFGTPGHNSVYVFGPNDGVREVQVEVRGTTLSVTQSKNAPRTVQRVIIRIGINNLNYLSHMGGCASIEAVGLCSNGLFIITAKNSTGNMYLAGNMDVRRVSHAGSGRINIFGASNTYGTEIETAGTSAGTVNISGRYVRLRTINHHGAANINIMGAVGNNIKVYADGKGKIGINGRVCFREIRAKGDTCVYSYSVVGGSIYVYVEDHARVGLAGFANDLFVETSSSARFEGRYLCVQSAYVRAYDGSHINVSASGRIFAAATQNASVYFYGEPDIMSQFVSGNGLVIPIWSNGYRNCAVPVHVVKRVSYKGEVEDDRRVVRHHRRRDR